jgi:hypothetical protein
LRRVDNRKIPSVPNFAHHAASPKVALELPGVIFCRKSQKGEPLDIDTNVRKFLDGRNANERYASFDYCFNYFQSFREAANVSLLASFDNIQLSCLHLGFYLASWGMFRGSTELLQKSARYLIPTVEAIARTDPSVWEIDADRYTEPNIRHILEVAGTIRAVQPGMSDTLLTKIMLGVFGCVPAFDVNFRRACKPEGLVATFGARALRRIGSFYQDNTAVIEAHRLPTLNFTSGGGTQRRYTRAKIIDMACFIEGERLEQLAKAAAAVTTAPL